MQVESTRKATTMLRVRRPKFSRAAIKMQVKTTARPVTILKAVLAASNKSTTNLPIRPTNPITTMLEETTIRVRARRGAAQDREALAATTAAVQTTRMLGNLRHSNNRIPVEAAETTT